MQLLNAASSLRCQFFSFILTTWSVPFAIDACLKKKCTFPMYSSVLCLCKTIRYASGKHSVDLGKSFLQCCSFFLNILVFKRKGA